MRSYAAFDEWGTFGIVGALDMLPAVWSYQRAEIRFLVYPRSGDGCRVIRVAKSWVTDTNILGKPLELHGQVACARG